MDRQGFKIGDKVRLKDPCGWSISMKIGVVVGFDTYIRVTWGGDMAWANFPHISREIEHVPKVGEQLMFSFMQ